jgi:uncharacterized protein (TIGR00730 family)
MKKRVCVFASSSSLLDKTYLDAAAELGALLGKNNFDYVYGGSNLGLMWASAKAAKDNGAKITGVMPEMLYNLCVSKEEECDNFIITQGMRERKAKLDENSDAVIALPGGFGTLEELAEMIVQKQLGYNKKPIILLNTNGFYNKLNEFFEVIISENFAKEKSREMYYIADTPIDAIEYLKNYLPPEIVISKHDIYNVKP